MWCAGPEFFTGKPEASTSLPPSVQLGVLRFRQRLSRYGAFHPAAAVPIAPKT